MYIYETGAVGEAVRHKIENTKNAVANGAERDSTPFSTVVKSMLQRVDGTAAATSGNTPTAADKAGTLDGASLLYLLQNSDNSLGGILSTHSGGGLKNAASELQTASVALLSGADCDKLGVFVDKYNALVNSLISSGSSSAPVYLNALETCVTAGSAQLSEAGISTDGGYTLSYSGVSDTPDASGLSSVISGVSSAAMQIYASASASSLGGSDSYLQSLIGSML